MPVTINDKADLAKIKTDEEIQDRPLRILSYGVYPNLNRFIDELGQAETELDSADQGYKTLRGNKLGATFTPKLTQIKTTAESLVALIDELVDINSDVLDIQRPGPPDNPGQG